MFSSPLKSSFSAVLLAAAAVCVLADASKVPNDTTKFELAWLIIWVLLTFALLVLAGMRLVKLPNLIKGNKIVTIVMVLMQLVVFVFLLAAMGHDQWSTVKYSFGNAGTVRVDYGVTMSRGPGSQTTYADSCTSDNAQGQPSGWLDWCNTIRAAGAFVILFGVIGLIVSFVLLIVATLSLVGVSAINPAITFVPVFANLQWICFLAIVMIWGVSGHDPLAQSFSSGSPKLELGASWALAFIVMIFGIVVAFFYAGGTGENIKGASTGAAGGGAAGQPQQQPVQWSPPQQQQQPPAVQPTH